LPFGVESSGGKGEGTPRKKEGLLSEGRWETPEGSGSVQQFPQVPGPDRGGGRTQAEGGMWHETVLHMQEGFYKKSDWAEMCILF